MSAFACTSGRITLRRAAQRKQQAVSSLTKRPKSSAVEKPNPESAGDATSGRTIPTPDTILQQPLWQRLGPVSKVFNAYGRAQKERTYATQFCTSVVIYFCGDLSAQTIGGEDYNAWRTVRNVLIGGLCAIPSYNWYDLCGLRSQSKAELTRQQVYVSCSIIQLFFQTFIISHQSARKSDRFRAPFQ